MKGWRCRVGRNSNFQVKIQNIAINFNKDRGVEYLYALAYLILSKLLNC